MVSIIFQVWSEHHGGIEEHLAYARKIEERLHNEVMAKLSEITSREKKRGKGSQRDHSMFQGTRT